MSVSVGRYRDRSQIERKETERALHIKKPGTAADFKMYKKSETGGTVRYGVSDGGFGERGRRGLKFTDEPTGSVKLVQHYPKEIPVILFSLSMRISEIADRHSVRFSSRVSDS